MKRSPYPPQLQYTEGYDGQGDTLSCCLCIIHTRHPSGRPLSETVALGGTNEDHNSANYVRWLDRWYHEPSFWTSNLRVALLPLLPWAERGWPAHPLPGSIQTLTPQPLWAQCLLITAQALCDRALDIGPHRWFIPTKHHVGRQLLLSVYGLSIGVTRWWRPMFPSLGAVSSFRSWKEDAR